MKNLCKKHQDIIDYFEPKIIAHILSGQDIKISKSEINNNTILIRYDFDRDSVIKNIRFFFRENEEFKSNLFIAIGNFHWNGTNIRSQLLKNGIKEYKKSKYGEGHHYRFDFKDVERIEKIFLVFEKYLSS